MPSFFLRSFAGGSSTKFQPAASAVPQLAQHQRQQQRIDRRWDADFFNMLPLGLLNAAQGHPMLVELKNGETLNGHLVLCDTWMNLTLREVVQTSPEGDKFVRLPEVYVKGNNIKYLRVPDEIIDIVKEQQSQQGGYRGGRGGQGRGDHGGRGGDRGRGGRVADTGLACRRRGTGLAPKRQRIRLAHINKPAIDLSPPGRLYSEWAIPQPQNPTADELPNPIQPQPNLKLDPVEVTRLSASSNSDSASPTSIEIATRTAGTKALLRSPLEFPPQTVDVPTNGIYDALIYAQHLYGQGRKIRRLVRYLVEERGERPNLVLYWSLVSANRETTTGSAAELAAILKEMRSLGIEPPSNFYKAALRVLAVHPDYLTRNTIMQKIKAQDLDLMASARHSVSLGLLRDGQNEMALDYWDQMRQDGIEIPEWLSDIFICVMVLRGFLDEAVQLLYQRLEMVGGDASRVPRVLWSYLLDECSRNLHCNGTSFIWDKMVRQGRLNPPDGVAVNVLHTAARHGDTTLATAVLELLSGRGVKLGLLHYEPLIETYVQAGDLENAFRALHIIRDAGIRVDSRNTRPIFLLLKRSPELVDKAVGFLRGMGKEGYLPVRAIDVLLEAVLQTRGFEQALDMYRQVCDLCESGPDKRTFGLLLDACGKAEHAVFLVSEMDRFSVRPSSGILDNLVRCFAHDGSLDVALVYLSEMDSASDRALEAVVRRCCRDRDPRVWAVMGEVRKRGLKLGEDVREILSEIPRA
ncbi:hypothetical protein N657DRAFT_670293 [Parathielavia appendiculata]|uniref:Sm domain-containing protein n=1 Tax=Parathielavia appendiculata TaxID=2587402 RepID=A0AAN6U722_9PEZI|nr:hypothetical protein N657DRAFT_670293 [Parathielavia appendiculata]